ncbi:MAG: 30S ribosomal protein S8 [Rhabdochlamydiaceae bacterium]|nr:30S ribosomal protein S8 [Rhabdochlamydiaceae bacterium]
MALFDPVADLLTRIRNAKDARHRFVDFRPSKMKMEIVRVLHEQGFIDKFLVDEKQGKARVFLKYAEGRDPVIKGLKRVSCPSIRKYIGYKKIPRIYGGLGVAIISTPSGIIDGETARQRKVGGELLCFVW